MYDIMHHMWEGQGPGKSQNSALRATLDATDL